MKAVAQRQKTPVVRQDKNVYASNAAKHFAQSTGGKRSTDMTEPHQRTRALLETKQFLYELQDPKLMPRVPAAVRKLAGKLLQHYPSYADIELVHKKLPLIFGPSPPFSGAYVRTAITELGLDKIGSKE